MQSRRLFSQGAARNLFHQQSRTYQTFTKNYMTGFDRMLLDKLKWARLGGHWFALFGIMNATLYGASWIMRKDQFSYHFQYKSYPIKMFKGLKSMMASDYFFNVVWTAPSLIGLSFYLHKLMGPVAMTKLFFMCYVSSVVFWSAFHPDSGLNYRPLYNFFPKLDAQGEDGSYYMGADQMAMSLIYFTLLYHRQWQITLGLMAIDTLYYGPMHLGACFAPLTAALSFF